MDEPGAHEQRFHGLEAMAGGDVLRGDLEYQRIVTAGARALFGGDDDVKIGRYAVLGKLGAGNMGEVYACLDGNLGRKVAVKWVLGEADDKGHARLRREAQALAKLSHPNVVQIHEIGEHRGRLFIAMEFVDGGTLSDWLAEQPHTVAEILEIFMSAGRGLAAAHRAGLVHRDFKPDNVLVGADGSVRVADFGVAFVGERGPEYDQTLSGAQDDERLTVTGAMMGTIRYMPLEQLHGSTVDARADQFAFCVALYEALWQRPPFPLGTRQDRVRALEREDAPLVPPDDLALFRVIARGLAHEAGARWSDMDALLGALANAGRSEESPRSNQRVRWFWPASACVLAVGFLAVWFIDRAPEPCANIEEQLRGVWDESTRTKLAERLDTLKAAHVADSRTRVFARLDHWATAWMLERRSACEKLNDPDQSQIQESRAWNLCLTRQLSRAQVLVHELSQGDAKVLANAVATADQLGDPAACADELGRLGVEPPPPTIRESVEGIRARLDEAREQRLLGARDTVKVIEVLEREAAELGYAPLQAEIVGEHARALDASQPLRAADLYLSAAELADSIGDAPLAAELLIERTELALHEMQEFAQAPAYLHWATSTAARAGMNDQTRARLAFARGRLLQYQGNLAEADARYLEALRLSATDSLARPVYLDARAEVQLDVDAALQLRHESLALATELFGPNHPITAKHLYDHGAALMLAGQDGRTELERAAELCNESGEDRWEAKAKLLLGSYALDDGDTGTAEQLANVAAGLLAGALPDGHAERGEPEQLLALVEATRGEHEAAIEHARAALDVFERGPDTQGNDPRAQQMRLLIGNELLSGGRFDEARAHLQVLADAQGDAVSAAIARVRLAEISVRTRDLDDADNQLRQAAPMRDNLGGEQVAYELLRSLVDLRLRRLGTEQLGELERVRDAHPEVPLAAWLDELELDATERTSLGLSMP
jgi:serine/threonine protein kinase